MISLFPKQSDVSAVALNILKKRYFTTDETEWSDVAARVVDYILAEADTIQHYNTFEMINNRYFIPNSPCLVNAGKKNAGLFACYVVDFRDTTEEIYKTKLEFAQIARKGGGCGTTLSLIRPEGSIVNGSAHGYAGGPVKFADTISHDMDALTQSGFRSMAIMFTMSVYHPDIIKFITAKHEEGKIANANISVTVDDEFMRKVENGETYFTRFNGMNYTEYRARDIFNMIVDSAWRNGEPGLLFYDRMNDSPYKYSEQEILATNPCAEQPLPPNGSCNLGSLDVAKFLTEDGNVDYKQLEIATRLAVRFLDKVIDKTCFPTKDIEEWSMNNRPIGLGIMGFADYCLKKEITYGSQESLDDLSFLLNFIYKVAEDESIVMGEELGIPKNCQLLPTPRRNITLLTIAPTGTISLLAGCSSGIEPIFSEITIRNDKTGSYQFENDLVSKPYFRCAVASNGATEVTWEEHIDVLATAQRFVDSGVSKTINFPTNTHRETIYKAYFTAWKKGCKGLAVYRNASRKQEVLSPKALKKDVCPVCKADILKFDTQKKCSKCDWSMQES